MSDNVLTAAEQEQAAAEAADREARSALDRAREKLEKAKAAYEKLAAAESAKKRKARRALEGQLGGMMLRAAESDPDVRRMVVGFLKPRLTTERDKVRWREWFTATSKKEN